MYIKHTLKHCFRAPLRFFLFVVLISLTSFLLIIQFCIYEKGRTELERTRQAYKVIGDVSLIEDSVENINDTYNYRLSDEEAMKKGMVIIMNILELNQVSYTYKNRFHRVDAVKSISTSFEQGKVYAIVGKSGSGKSTLLSVLAGLDLPTEGEVTFEGMSLADINLDRYRRNDISVIYQAFHLFPLLTAVENVMYPMELQKVKSKEARKRANDLLHKMQLEDHCFKHYPSMLSGGEQQRVAIARALASNPKILLADEPTGNLDSENSRRIVDILLNLAHEDNYCIILITHDLEIANRTDIILHLKDGALVS